jgi:hypothetical protein
MTPIGKLIFVAGLGMALIGLVLWLGSNVPWLRLGRLPGDVMIRRDGFTFFFPVTTMILLSIMLTLVFWIVSLLRR